MKYLKRFNEEYFNKQVNDYLRDIGLSLSDNGIKMVYQTRGDKEMVYLSGSLGFSFTLADIREEVNHIISYIEDSGYSLLSARYKEFNQNLIWKVIYDSSKSWNVSGQSDIFEIKDFDLSKQKIEIFELVFILK